MALLKKILDLIYPPQEYCYNCSKRIDYSELNHLCVTCLKKIDFIEEFCEKCGRELADGEEICAGCLATEPVYSLARSIAVYEGIFRDLIIKYKYTGKKELYRPFSHLMLPYFNLYFKEKGIDYIIPIPLHQNREKKRGFNQVGLMAGELTQLTGIPLLAGLVRVKDSPPLYNLSTEERLRVITGCFNIVANANLRDKTILLVDDILTTGTTVNEASAVLLNQGKARAVYVLTLVSI
ncbi:MAG: ComF family protein [Halanaerobiales bacterium]|nr:ComF family protein [Halanaerobiales bacterium]